MSKAIKDRIEELRTMITKWNYHYYVLDKPLVSDKLWDKHYTELGQLEEKYPQYNSPTSPTNIIGGYVASQLVKVDHERVMYSLDKRKEKDQLIKWWSDLGKPELLASTKADGLAIELVYTYILELGFSVLSRASTRGDGRVGEDVTHNAMVVKNIPKMLPIKHNLTVYGEAVIPKNEFRRINFSLPEENRYKTARNLSAGSMRQLDSSACEERGVLFIAYGAYSKEWFEHHCPTEFLFFRKLKGFGFDVVEQKVLKSPKEIESFIKHVDSVREHILYDIDGVVFKVNEIKKHESFGYTAKFPKFAMCYKFEDDEYETRIIDIEWNTARTRRINPTGIIEPVVIDGTEVTRVTLNNMDFIEEFELGKGDRVIVRKANMIIPELVENLDRTNTFKLPRKCPACGENTIVRVLRDVPFLYCTNNKCSGAQLARLVHFCSRGALNIDGLSVGKLQHLIDEGFISDYEDILELPNRDRLLSDIRKCEGWGYKSVEKMVDAINLVKVDSTLDRFIYALGIPNVGTKTAYQLCEAFYFDLKRILCATSSELRAVGLGEVVSNSILKYIEKNKGMISRLARQFTFVEYEEVKVESNKLDGKTFCITGKYKDFNRDRFAELILTNGGNFIDKVNKDTDYLVVGDEPGKSKVTKASNLGVKILSVKQLDAMLR